LKFPLRQLHKHVGCIYLNHMHK